MSTEQSPFCYSDIFEGQAASRARESEEAASSAGAPRARDSQLHRLPLEYRARSVFCVLTRGFSSKRETASSLLPYLLSEEIFANFSNAMSFSFNCACF